jgi:uncharacterized protein YbjT (DUF2867 family)
MGQALPARADLEGPEALRRLRKARRVIRFLVRTLVLLLANAIGLFVANLVLDDMRVTASLALGLNGSDHPLDQR